MARVYKWGDWQKARSRFRGLAFRLERAADRGLKEEAEAAARRLRNNLFAGNYEEFWPELAPATVARKEAKGHGDNPMLIDDGEYVRAIEAFHLGRGVYAVGVRDPRLAAIGEQHEWGIGVPSRPHWRPELERIRTGRLSSIGAAMRSVLEGRE